MGESFAFCLARLDSRLLVLDPRFTQESRIANQVKNRDSQWTVNLLLNSTVHEVLHEVHAIKFTFTIICINDQLIIFISG